MDNPVFQIQAQRASRFCSGRLCHLRQDAMMFIQVTDFETLGSSRKCRNQTYGTEGHMDAQEEAGNENVSETSGR